MAFVTRRAMLSSTAVALVMAGLPAQAQAPADTEWRNYANDLANTRYAPLDQINASNFNKLEVAWRFNTDNLGPRPENNLEATPLMANGVLYSTAGTRRAMPGHQEQHRDERKPRERIEIEQTHRLGVHVQQPGLPAGGDQRLKR